MKELSSLRRREKKAVPHKIQETVPGLTVTYKHDECLVNPNADDLEFLSHTSFEEYHKQLTQDAGWMLLSDLLY